MPPDGVRPTHHQGSLSHVQSTYNTDKEINIVHVAPLAHCDTVNIYPVDIMSGHALEESSFDLTGAVQIMDPLSCQPGSHADLYLAEWKGSIVCVKVLRYIGRPSDEEARHALDTQAKRELTIWSSMKHPNILPILGFCSRLGPSLAFISPLVSGGCAPEYLRAHPFVDRLKLVSEIGEGLNYIHGKDIIHGDLKGANVLVMGPPNHPVPLICDFGLSKSSNATDSSSGPCGTLGWMAIELLSAPDDACMPTFASDVWSWGMTVLELFTDTVPCLDKCDNPYIFISHIAKGRYPDYPGSPAAERGLSLDMWHLLFKCWSPVPSQRPSAASVVSETMHIRTLWLLTEDARIQFEMGCGTQHHGSVFRSFVRRRVVCFLILLIGSIVGFVFAGPILSWRLYFF